MNTSSVRIYSNVKSSQIRETDSHFHISNIPICKNDSCMNGVAYLDKYNREGMPTLKGKPLTISHPVVGNVNVSAKSDEGLDFYSGTRIHEQPFLDGGRWFMNTSIVKSKLMASNESMYNIIKARKPFGVSTGLTFEANNESGEVDGKKYSMVAKNQTYDHVALLDPDVEMPAGGEDTMIRGYNAEGKQVDIIVCNADAPETNESKLEAAFNAFMTTAKSLFVKESQNSYNNADGKQPEFTNNQDGEDIMDRTQIIGLLSGKGISVNADISDADLMAMLTNAVPEQFKKESKKSEDADDDGEDEDDKPKKKAKNSASLTYPITMDMIDGAITKAVNAAIAPLETQLAANHNIELDGLKSQMKSMTVNKLSDSVIDKMDPQEMKDHLAANGQVGFNATSGHTITANADEQGFTGMTMPNIKES